MAPWDRAFKYTDAIKNLARAPPCPGAFQKSIPGKLSCSIFISFHILLGGSGPLDNARTIPEWFTFFLNGKTITILYPNRSKL